MGQRWVEETRIALHLPSLAMLKGEEILVFVGGWMLVFNMRRLRNNQALTDSHFFPTPIDPLMKSGFTIVFSTVVTVAGGGGTADGFGEPLENWG